MTTNDVSEGDYSRGDDDGNVRIDENADRSELAARIELLTEENRNLREENERLRNDSAHSHRPRYRRLGLGLVLLGALSGIGVFAFPEAQNVLVALAATGLFGGVLTVYLSQGDFLEATVCDRIYAAVAANGRSLVDERNLGDERIYVPDGDGGAHLFVPKEADFPISDAQNRSVSSGNPEHGVILTPTGEGLFREFERTVSGESRDTPSRLTTRLADAIVEQFELAGSVEPTVDRAGDDRVVVAISDSVLGDVDRFDHPITSFLAVGLAVGLERPVTLTVTPHADRSEWLATYQWEPSDDSS